MWSSWFLGSMNDPRACPRETSISTHPNKDKLLEELQNKSNGECTLLSSSANEIKKNRGNVEGFELGGLSRKVQLLTIYISRTYIADAERSFLKLKTMKYESR